MVDKNGGKRLRPFERQCTLALKWPAIALGLKCPGAQMATKTGSYTTLSGKSKSEIPNQELGLEILTGPQFAACAGDNGPPHVCHTVAVTGLCSTLRYGRYCCRTCADRKGHN
ncbi:hypothetical protein niasHS_012618 [Heterodera schachtii]|uniref:PLAC domain-containing protein n=1 Tax=Heterodera schachtii TaxID=97005 RepID=A0ABD2IHW1_HETSC